MQMQSQMQSQVQVQSQMQIQMQSQVQIQMQVQMQVVPDALTTTTTTAIPQQQQRFVPDALRPGECLAVYDVIEEHGEEDGYEHRVDADEGGEVL